MQNRSQEAANTICPVCGEAVDPMVQVVIAAHASEEDGDGILRIGTCCAECRCMVAGSPDLYYPVVLRNGVAVGG